MLPARVIFLSTLVPGSGNFKLPDLAGLGYGLWVRVRVLGSVHHNRFHNSNHNLNHNPNRNKLISGANNNIIISSVVPSLPRSLPSACT